MLPPVVCCMTFPGLIVQPIAAGPVTGKIMIEVSGIGLTFPSDKIGEVHYRRSSPTKPGNLSIGYLGG